MLRSSLEPGLGRPFRQSIRTASKRAGFAKPITRNTQESPTRLSNAVFCALCNAHWLHPAEQCKPDLEEYREILPQRDAPLGATAAPNIAHPSAEFQRSLDFSDIWAGARSKSLNRASAGLILMAWMTLERPITARNIELTFTMLQSRLSAVLEATPRERREIRDA